MSDKTMIWIRKDTREKLKQMGHKGETYDDIINNLILYARGKK